MACPTRATIVVKSKFCLKQLAVTLAALVVLAPVSARDDARWPQVPLPKQVDVFEVGNEMVVNGMPVRMRGFVSRAAPAELAAAMRQLLGTPLMENHRGTTLVLGRGEGPFYITVQLAPLGSGTRALIAVTRPPISEQRPADFAAERQLLSAFPPGSTLAGHTSATDGPARADQSAIVNSHSIDINTEHVKRMMHADGFTLEREARPRQASRTWVSASGARTMFFRRAGAEAIAVVARNESGNSVIVLNRVSFAAHAK